MGNGSPPGRWRSSRKGQNDGETAPGHHHRVGPRDPGRERLAATWHALLADRSGVAPITLFDASGFSVRIAAKVKEFDPRHAIEDQAPLKFARVFGTTAPPVTAFKWAFGDPLAASGILDAVMVLVALRRGVVPGVATLRELDPELANLPVSGGPQASCSDVALVLNRGFGGSNTALLLRAAASDAVDRNASLPSSACSPSLP